MKIGFIGSGNMATAIIGGILKSEPDAEICVSDKNLNQAKQIADKYNVCISENNIELAKCCDIIFISVKPDVVPSVCDEIKNTINSSTIIVSIAAGVSVEKLEMLLGSDKKIIRLMPNTPALVGEGMTAACMNSNVSSEIDIIVRIFNSFGRCEIVDEKLMSTVTAVSGSSPAYVFMLIEAMADAAVQGGMNRQSAYTFAAQAVLGSAKMVLDTCKHPGELKDMVCSPKGTTIDAVAKLEEKGFRSAVIEAIRVCREKSERM